jgi:nitrite reductase/ring-hydroxylating ferredoxin subunit
LRYKIGKVKDLPDGEMRQYDIAEKNILVINQNGHFFALSSKCSHVGGPLAKGNLKDGILTCPWQGSQFRITDGSVIKGPSKKPLTVYPIEIENGYLFIHI